jgi:hypothetical protein
LVEHHDRLLRGRDDVAVFGFDGESEAEVLGERG